MKIAKGVAALCAVCMGLALLNGFLKGDFGREGGLLLSMPWGIVSLVDLYVGFTLFSGWVIYREQSLIRSAIWVVLIMVLGFFAASIYALIALHSSGGNWHRFWLGRRELDAR